jgi:alpha-glucosidase
MPAAWTALAVDAQQGHSRSTLQLHREALRIRRQSEALRAGSFRWLEAALDTLAFERSAGGETVACIVDFAGRGVELPAGELLLDVPGAAWVRTA